MRRIVFMEMRACVYFRLFGLTLFRVMERTVAGQGWVGVRFICRS